MKLVLLLYGLTVFSSCGGVTGSIEDISDAPKNLKISVSEDVVTLSEGELMTTLVLLSEAPSESVTLNWRLDGDGTERFLVQSGQLTYPAGQSSRSFQLQSAQNEIYDGDEEVRIILSGDESTFASGASINLSIEDDEDLPTLSLGAGPWAAAEGTSGAISYELSHFSKFPVSFDWATTAGTALLGIDFNASPTRVTIAPLTASGVLSVAMVEDGLTEADKNLTVSISNPNGATLGASNSVSVTRLDNDYTINATLEQGSTQSDPATSLPLVFDLVFDRAIDPSSFTASDITVGGSAPSAVVTLTDSGDHQNFVLEVTSTSGDGGVTLQLSAGVVSDESGVTNQLATSSDNSVTLDQQEPEVTLATTASDPFKDSPLVATATFTESVSNFALDDLSLTNATASNLTGSGTTYSFELTPLGQGTIEVSVDAGAANDAAGNLSLVSNTLSRVYDSVAPSAATVLGWSQDSPHNATSIAAEWTKSVSTDLSTQLIQFYSDGSCSTTTGSLVDLNSTSAQTQSFSGSDGDTYSYQITSRDAAGNEVQSGCSSAMLVDTTDPAAPSFLSFSPSSPSTDSTPVVIGSASADTEDLSFYTEVTCETQVGTGSRTDFVGTGVALSLASNQEVHLYAKATDSAGNDSDCTLMASYRHDTIDPTAPTGLSLGAVPDDLTVSPTISWTAGTDTNGSGVASYRMEIYLDSDDSVESSWQVIVSGAAASGLTLEEGETYYAKLVTVDAAGNTSTPAQTSAWTASAGAAAPAAPLLSQISAGIAHSCWLTDDGVAYCWQIWGYGVLGSGGGLTVNQESPSPVQMTGSLSGKSWNQIVAGFFHTCGITTEGKAYCWGDDYDGQLGNGSSISAEQESPSPVEMTGALNGKSWAQLSASAYHTCGITTEGVAYCWGDDGFETLGNGATLSDPQASPSPVEMTGTLSGKSWAQISAGSLHTCGITTEGKAYCWGLDTLGRLGGGATLSYPQASPSPVEMTGTLSGKSWAQISAGNIHTCGITTDGDAYCWGDDANGELGNGATPTVTQVSPSPVEMMGELTGKSWAQIEADYGHTCGLTTEGKFYCWGKDERGVLGNGATLTADQVSPTPVDMTGTLSGKSWTQLGTSLSHTCGITTDGLVYCWGADSTGQLGNGATLTAEQTSPSLVDSP